MDMEKILVTPSLQIGKLYYTQKLKTFNFTVFNLGTSEVNNFMWHEGVGTKGSSEIATCLWKSLSSLKPEVKEVTFYADTASGQNRNSINAAMFLRAVTILPLTIINQKFMESGHSEMECDSVHSCIENRGNKVDVFTPEGWYAVARTAKIKKPLYQVTPMDFTDFLDFKNFASKTITNRNKTEDGATLNWLKVKWLQYRKEDPSRIYFKERLSDLEFKTIRIKLRATTRKDEMSLTQKTIPRLYKSNLKIESKKITSLRKLCSSGSIPSAYHAFYEKYLQSDDEDNESMVDSSDEET
ncbi:hypothetical protein RI129_002866 [Pyrocoelia pectoralis]|uniref:Uncharacterized protein n=1 Tax=Pyrocoelia pectoralis TaxID=417401 RepID=A0AAN7VQI0_9COLE